VPPVRRLRALRDARSFWRARDVRHFGIFTSFAEAVRSIPPGHPIGWDHAAAAAMFDPAAARVNPRDYPVLFWMRSLWTDGITVFDFGGHAGAKRYAFERYLPFDDEKRWIICDVPAVVDEGRRLAAQRGARALSFTTDFAAAADATLLLCLGVLQFLEEPLAERLRALPRLPPHVIVNGMPLHPRLSYVTLVNNDGNGFCPYRVFSKPEFVTAMGELGYRVVDEWANAEKGLWIPGFEDHDLSHYTGFYFRLGDVAAPASPTGG
jgi:putative methyltransferase (TIGR04325 family)